MPKIRESWILQAPREGQGKGQALKTLSIDIPGRRNQRLGPPHLPPLLKHHLPHPNTNPTRDNSMKIPQKAVPPPLPAELKTHLVQQRRHTVPVKLGDIIANGGRFVRDVFRARARGGSGGGCGFCGDADVEDG